MLFPSNDELRFAIVNNPLYKWFVKGERLQDVLWELEVASRGPFAEKLARPSSLWVEHVMPQSWEAHWPLPANADLTAHQPARDRRERLIHTLGNLTLTTDRLNIALGNGMFEAKRAKLDASLLALNKWFASRGEWNEAAIEERSRELAERAIAIWPHPDAAARA
ncbi:HNH endonuclease family protein [Sphingomonas sp.]|uniref:HNH endonuclease family protein n=1 Tax=Sphingomonas sp. TaxID=28214 RepID=UPI003CC67956